MENEKKKVEIDITPEEGSAINQSWGHDEYSRALMNDGGIPVFDTVSGEVLYVHIYGPEYDEWYCDRIDFKKRCQILADIGLLEELKHEAPKKGWYLPEIVVSKIPRYVEVPYIPIKDEHEILDKIAGEKCENNIDLALDRLENEGKLSKSDYEAYRGAEIQERKENWFKKLGDERGIEYLFDIQEV